MSHSHQRRASRPIVRTPPPGALLDVMARGECWCSLIDAKDRPCLSCRERRPLQSGELFALVVAAAIVLAVIAAMVVGATTDAGGETIGAEVAKPCR